MTDAPFPAEHAVLGALLDGPAHGYELCRRLRDDLGLVWRIATSQLYAVLRRLEEAGMVRWTGEADPRGRHVYALTPHGEAAFWEWAVTPVPRVRDLRVEFVTKLYFLYRFAPDRVGELVARQRDVVLRLRNRLAGEEPPGDPFSAALEGFRMSQVRCALDWLQGLRT